MGRESRYLRVAVMTVDIDLAFTSPRGIVATSGRVVAEHRYHDASLASLVNDILEIVRVRELFAVNGPSVLVLRLVDDDGSAVCNLRFGNSGGNVGNVANPLAFPVYVCL